jgi:hypothetical protein
LALAFGPQLHLVGQEERIERIGMGIWRIALGLELGLAFL